MTKRTVLLVEDNDELRDSFSQALAGSGDFDLVAAVPTVREALAALDAHAPEMALVDLGLPDGSGIDVIKHAVAKRPDCLVMVVTVFGDERNVISSIEAGAVGYVLKDTGEGNFLASIRDMAAGGAPISPAIARHLLSRVRTPSAAPATPMAATTAAAPRSPTAEGVAIGLTDREREVLQLMAKGYNFPEVGKLLGVGTETVKTHIKRVYQKLAVHNKNEAVFEAQRLGILGHPADEDRSHDT
jgi:DNA-binding NarL/FixJ family response regulator